MLRFIRNKEAAVEQAGSLLGVWVAEWLLGETKLHWRSWLPGALLPQTATQPGGQSSEKDSERTAKGRESLPPAADPNAEPLLPEALPALLGLVAATSVVQEAADDPQLSDGSETASDGPLASLQAVLQAGPYTEAACTPGLGQAMVRGAAVP